MISRRPSLVTRTRVRVVECVPELQSPARARVACMHSMHTPLCCSAMPCCIQCWASFCCRAHPMHPKLPILLMPCPPPSAPVAVPTSACTCVAVPTSACTCAAVSTSACTYMYMYMCCRAHLRVHMCCRAHPTSLPQLGSLDAEASNLAAAHLEHAPAARPLLLWREVPSQTFPTRVC